MLKFFAATAILCLICASANTVNAKDLFTATLTGDQEVPPVDTPASGKAFFRLNQAETAIEFQLHVNEGLGITQSHIHCAPAGAPGPIVVFLAGLHAAGLNIDGKWISNATITEASIVNTACGATVEELAESMRSGNTYVNVHSLAVPSGEIRGQIEPTN